MHREKAKPETRVSGFVPRYGGEKYGHGVLGGIMSSSPTCRRSLVRPFAALIASTVTPYLSAIANNVSPDLTLCTTGTGVGGGTLVGVEVAGAGGPIVARAVAVAGEVGERRAVGAFVGVAVRTRPGVGRIGVFAEAELEVSLGTKKKATAAPSRTTIRMPPMSQRERGRTPPPRSIRDGRR